MGDWAAKVLADVPRTNNWSDGEPYIKEADALAAIVRMGAGDGLDEASPAVSNAILRFWKKMCEVHQDRIAALTAQVAEAEREAESRSAMFATACKERDAAEAEAAAQRERVARLEGALIAEREENLLHCYNIGSERDGRWSDCCMSDAEWLVSQCGLDPDEPDYDATAVKAAIPVAARRAALNDGGKDG